MKFLPDPWPHEHQNTRHICIKRLPNGISKLRPLGSSCRDLLSETGTAKTRQRRTDVLFRSSVFSHKGALVSQRPGLSDQWHRQSCGSPSFFSDPSVLISVSHYVPLFLTLLDSQVEGCSRRCHMMSCGPVVVAQTVTLLSPWSTRQPLSHAQTLPACTAVNQVTQQPSAMCSCLLYTSLVRESKLKEIKISGRDWHVEGHQAWASGTNLPPQGGRNTASGSTRSFCEAELIDSPRKCTSPV